MIIFVQLFYALLVIGFVLYVICGTTKSDGRRRCFWWKRKK